MPTPRSKVKSDSEVRLVHIQALSSEDLIRAYLDHKRASGWRPNTVKIRALQLHKIATELAPATFLDATEEQLLAWHDHRPGLPETRASYASAVHGIYRWLTRTTRMRPDDPSLILDRPRIPQAQPRPMHDRHYDLALACAVANPEMYLWLGLMGCSGLRCCEVAWMNVGDVEQRDDGSGLLHITGKGGKQRVVPAGPMLMLTMQPFLRGRGPVFTRPSDGKAHTPNMVSYRVSKHLQDCGVPAPNRAHSLRHRFGTDYHALDHDLYRQAKLMGHASVDTTQLYTAISPIEAARYVAQLTEWRLQPRTRPALQKGRVA